jgi:hypothetical protein
MSKPIGWMIRDLEKNMNKAPERIWATSYYNQNRSDHVKVWSSTGFDDHQQVEYIRADLVPKIHEPISIPETIDMLVALGVNLYWDADTLSIKPSLPTPPTEEP